MIDLSDEILRRICWARQDALKSMWEITGINFDDTSNKIDYHNYMISNPLKIGGPGLGGADWGSGPSGFYSDEVLYNFITRAEGPIGLRWVTTVRGSTPALGCGIDGWDFPGGVHSKAIANAMGLSASEFASWVTVSSTNGRVALQGELREGAAWGWCTSPLTKENPYWAKLIPYYRNEMLWAWNQPQIQAISDPAERLARMHSINWWGHHYMKGLTVQDSGYQHRLKAAQTALSMSAQKYNA